MPQNKIPLKSFTMTDSQTGDSIQFTAIDFSQCPDNCELCGSEDELRPYGDGGKWICFECMLKDEETVEKNFGRILNGNDITDN